MVLDVKSERETPSSVPRHVAIIMDGNGRWAQSRGLSRVDGHSRGVEVVRAIVKHAIARGIRFLTLYAFSSENWGRPGDEVQEIMRMVPVILGQELDELCHAGVRCRFLGSREGLDSDVSAMIDHAEDKTRDNERMVLSVAFNYGARDEIVRAVRKVVCEAVEGHLKIGDLTEARFAEYLDTAGTPEPDLLIRTSGEKRLSNFLLWQCAYTEFVFTDRLWPDFEAESFDRIIEEFNRRDRRFGGIGKVLGDA